jgi:hypothetical protein
LVENLDHTISKTFTGDHHNIGGSRRALHTGEDGHVHFDSSPVPIARGFRRDTLPIGSIDRDGLYKHKHGRDTDP